MSDKLVDSASSPEWTRADTCRHCGRSANNQDVRAALRNMYARIESLQRDLDAARLKLLQYEPEQVACGCREAMCPHVVPSKMTPQQVIDNLRGQVKLYRDYGHECDTQLNAARLERDTLRAHLASAEGDANQYRWWRTWRQTTLIVSMFGNGCVNRRIEDVEDRVIAALAADKPQEGAQ